MNDPNERRVFLAIAVCLVATLIWLRFVNPPTPAPAATEEPVAAATGEAPSPAPSAVTPSGAPSEAPPAATEPACTDTLSSVQSPLALLQAGDCGGGLHEVEFPGRPAPLTVTPWWTWIFNKVTGSEPSGWHPYVDPEATESLLSAQGVLGYAGTGAFADPRGTYTVTRSGEGVRAVRQADGLTVTQSFAPTEDPDLFQVTTRFESSTPVTGPLWIAAGDLYQAPVGTYDSNPRPAAVVDGDLYLYPYSSGCGGESPQPEGPVSWFGVQDRYFLAALIPSDPTWGSLRVESLPDGRTGAFLVHQGNLAPGAPVEVSFDLFVGPKDAERLEVLGRDLPVAGSLGFFGLFSRVLLFILHIFHAGLANWGLAIIALTFLIRLLMYPLMRSSFRSSKEMAKIQPLLKELQEKYADDREAQSRETMKLFQQHGVNPLGGCLPLLVQIPVFWALLSALQHTPDLYHADFLYINDLSMPDPWGFFPFTMAVGMVLQQKITPLPANMDPTQAQMMRLMPYVFALFMFGLPAGLSLYYSVNTALSIAQQWYNTRPEKPATPATGA